MSSSTEIWKEWRDSNYSVSSHGRIRNDRTGLVLRPSAKIPGKGRKQTIYLVVDLYRKKMPVHRLVAELFIERTTGMNVVNHLDGNTLNNKVENLEWTSPLENVRHAVRMGLNRQPTPYKYKGTTASASKLGDKNPNSKLAVSDVHTIKYSLQHLSGTEVGKMFGVSSQTIHCIWSKRSWAHV